MSWPQPWRWNSGYRIWGYGNEPGWIQCQDWLEPLQRQGWSLPWFSCWGNRLWYWDWTASCRDRAWPCWPGWWSRHISWEEVLEPVLRSPGREGGRSTSSRRLLASCPFEHSDFLSRLIGVDEVWVVDNGFNNACIGCSDFVLFVCNFSYSCSFRRFFLFLSVLLLWKYIFSKIHDNKDIMRILLIRSPVSCMDIRR